MLSGILRLFTKLSIGMLLIVMGVFTAIGGAAGYKASPWWVWVLAVVVGIVTIVVGVLMLLPDTAPILGIMANKLLTVFALTDMVMLAIVIGALLSGGYSVGVQAFMLFLVAAIYFYGREMSAMKKIPPIPLPSPVQA